jgi:hypothetical protein
MLDDHGGTQQITENRIRKKGLEHKGTKEKLLTAKDAKKGREGRKESML